MATLAHDFTLWEDVTAKLLRTVGCHQGLPLSVDDNATLVEAIAMQCCLTVDLRKRCGVIGSYREIIAWAHNVHSLDVVELGTILSDVVVALRNVHTATTMAWFKRQVGSPRVLTVVGPVRKVLAAYLADPQPWSFSICNQFFSFMAHVSLPGIAWDVEKGYLELEASLCFPRVSEQLAIAIEPIIQEWFGSFALEEPHRPRHGKGAVYGLTKKATVADKYMAFGHDDLLRYVLLKQGVGDVSSFEPYGNNGLLRECQIVSVAKSMLARRVISKEEAEMQFWQQMVRRQWYSFIHRHPYLAQHIDFRAAELNGALALEGSRTGGFATIDLSAASDRITYPLVKRLFQRTPLWPLLVATRSRTGLLPSGKVIELAKFSPMGSATCFPLQTVIFAACVEYAMRRAQRTGLGLCPVWRVYGDDIVIEDDLYVDVVLVLETLGFVINAKKSFCSPARFRESCGTEGYDGIDVTPLKISRNFHSTGREITPFHAPDAIRIADLANQCLDRGFGLLRAFVLRPLLDSKVGPPLFSWEGRGAIASPMADNFRAARAVDWDLQSLRISVARPRISRDACYLCPGLWERNPGYLFETLRLIERRTGDMFSPEHRVRVRRSTPTVKWERTWVSPPS